MKPYLGPAGKPDYQRNLYRNNMQGGDHQSFIGYLLGEVQQLVQRVANLEAQLAHGEVPPLKVEPVVEAQAPAPVEVAKVQQVVAPIVHSKPVEPAREIVADSDVLQHIVLDLPDEPPAKKRGK